MAKELQETQQSFFKRRAKVLNDLKDSTHSSVVFVAIKKLVEWAAHIYRHKSSMLFKLLTCQNDDWLASRRSRNLTNLLAQDAFGFPIIREVGRPDTRAQVGTVFRWGEGWVAAVEREESLGWELEKGNKIGLHDRICFLREYFLPTSKEVAIEDALNSGESSCGAVLAITG